MSTEIKEKQSIKEILKEPSLYNVILHNDDYTTQEFVIEILVEIFHKTFSDAESLMLEVHNAGAAIVPPISALLIGVLSSFPNQTIVWIVRE